MVPSTIMLLYRSIEFYYIYHCFMSYDFSLFCKHIWDPKYVHRNLTYIC